MTTEEWDEILKDKPEGMFEPNPEYDYVKCNCPCHGDSNIIHFAPCCSDDGWNRIPKPTKDDKVL